MTTENTTEMTLKRKEELIDSLLIYMKNDLEKLGATIKTASFNFSLSYTEQYWGDKPDEIIPEGNDLTAFKQLVTITDNEFDIVIKTCMTHEYVDKMFCGTDYNGIQLTDSGFARANSVEKAKVYKSDIPQNAQNVVIHGNIIVQNSQIGNQNQRENTINPENKDNVLNKFVIGVAITVVAGIIIAIIKHFIGGM